MHCSREINAKGVNYRIYNARRRAPRNKSASAEVSSGHQPRHKHRIRLILVSF